MHQTDYLDEPYGDETRKEVKKPIDTFEKENGSMEMNRIEDLMVDVETYKQAVQDARDALASAEQELDEALDMAFGEDLAREYFENE